MNNIKLKSKKMQSHIRTDRGEKLRLPDDVKVQIQQFKEDRGYESEWRAAVYALRKCLPLIMRYGDAAIDSVIQTSVTLSPQIVTKATHFVPNEVQP